MSKAPVALPALSLWQPWATLLAGGAKRVETRSWPAPRTLPLPAIVAVHASLRWNEQVMQMCYRQPFYAALLALGHSSSHGCGYKHNLPRGAVVGLVRLAACLPAEELAPAGRDPLHTSVLLTEQERAFGDYSPGRWGWICAGAVRLSEPVPCAGLLGVWTWQIPPAAQDMVAAAIARLEAAP